MGKFLWNLLLIGLLAGTSALGGYMYRASLVPFEPCPLALPQGRLLYSLDTRYSRTCVYHPPVYGRAQHKLHMKRRQGNV